MLKQVNYDTESGLMILAGEVQTNTEATESEPREDDGMTEGGNTETTETTGNDNGENNGENNGEGGEGSDGQA